MWCKAHRRKKKKRKNKTVGRYIIQVDLFLIQWIFDGSRYVLSSQRSIFPFLSLDWFIYNIVQTSSLMQYYIVVNNTQTPCRTQSELNMTRDRGEKNKNMLFMVSPSYLFAGSNHLDGEKLCCTALHHHLCYSLI